MAANKQYTYPRFWKDQNGDVYAFLSKDRMFRLDTGTFGKGAGFEFRVYKTRATVLKYDKGWNNLSFLQFKMELSNIMGGYLMEVTDLLPKAMIDTTTKSLTLKK